MATALMEGQWVYKVDEKSRFPLPPKIRTKFGKTWILAFDSVSQVVILFPFETWQEKVSEAENPEQLRLDLHPFQNDLDAHGKLMIPRKLRELGKIGQGETIIIVSMGDRLRVEKEGG